MESDEAAAHLIVHAVSHASAGRVAIQTKHWDHAIGQLSQARGQLEEALEHAEERRAALVEAAH